MTALEEIAAERKRQIGKEGWSAEHDDEHSEGDIARASAAYALAASYSDYDRHPKKGNYLADWWVGRHSPVRVLWPWEWHWFKPTNRRRDLVKAGALIVAEIERLDRETAAGKEAAA